jgi:hypothetical protein
MEREGERTRERERLSHLSVQWVRSAIHGSQQPNPSYSFLSLKLPAPPCAVLLVYYYGYYGDDNDDVMVMMMMMVVMMMMTTTTMMMMW